MAPVDIDLWDLQRDQVEAFPPVLGIALEDPDRQRLTSLLDGTGVVRAGELEVLESTQPRSGGEQGGGVEDELGGEPHHDREQRGDTERDADRPRD